MWKKRNRCTLDVVTNGDHEAARRQRSRATAQGSAASPTRTAPLKVVTNREVDADGQLVETLECGHTHEARAGLMGTKLSPRRRCVKCLEEMQAAAAEEEA